MTAFYSTFFADPLYYIGYLFAFCTAIGFIIFLRGFLSGFGYALALNGHDEHMDKFRTRATWGVVLMAYTFGMWELLRLVVSWFGVGTLNSAAAFAAALGFIWLFCQLWRAIFPAKA